MNISNLQLNHTYKNYKQLCEVLEVKTKTGNSKKAQLKELERYCNYNKIGHSFTIQEIYSSPMDKEENRGGARNILLHGNRMDNILTYIINNEQHGELSLPINLLLKIMNMVNINYSYGNKYRKKVSRYLNIEENKIEEFFDSSRQTLKNNVESMLDRLENKALIYWYKIKTVCVTNVKAPLNNYGDIKVNYTITTDKYDNEEMIFHANTNIDKEYRTATEEEIELIIHTEGKVMDELNCNSKQELNAKNLFNKFIHEVNERLLDEANILFYYDSYKIIRNTERLEKEIDKLDNEVIDEAQYAIEKALLNLDVEDQLLNNMIKRQERASRKSKEGIINTKQAMRLSNTYITDGHKMIETFINTEHEDIREGIRKTKLNN